MAIGLVFLASSQCQFCDREGLFCSMSAGTTTGWIRQPCDGRRASDLLSISFRCRNPFFGAVQSHWLPMGSELFLSRVRVAADYSDSVPDSSKYVGSQGYHPLEEVKDHERNRDMVLTDAEIARTTVEANNNALIVFPGMVHCEPHKHVSWGEFQYVIDDCGDIFFEIFDDENILQDRGASNPVTVLIGMDTPLYGEHRRISLYDNSVSDSYLDISFDEDHDEVSVVSDTLIDWGMPDTSPRVHPVYFAKCLTKAVQAKYAKKMDNPSNGLSIVGCLRPAFIDEEPYLRGLFHGEDTDGYTPDWRDESEKEEEQVAANYNLIDGEVLHFDSRARDISSTVYKLEIMTMELFSVYGDQSMISLQDFEDAEPDILAHSAPKIIERFSDHGMKCCAALKALCRKKKGLIVEGARLIGVDSLGMDVRVFSGVEAQTLRFSFNARALSESAVEKKIWRMLFPRSHRKNLKIPSESLRNNGSF